MTSREHLQYTTGSDVRKRGSDILSKKSEQPGYWAVIPAPVRYDDRIPANAKLLYGEISALCDMKGFCWAKNEYFAQLFGWAAPTVTRLLASLRDAGYLTVEMVPTSTGSERRIFAGLCTGGVRKIAETPLRKNVGGVSAKMITPLQYKGNSTYEHTPLTPHGGKTRKKAEWEPERFEGLWKFYPEIRKADGTSTSKGDKSEARRAWNALRPSPELIDTMGVWLKAKLKYDDQYARGYGVKTVSVWLNGIRRNGGVLEMPEIPQETQPRPDSRVQERKGDYEI